MTTVLITGATRGIGATAARRLAEQGCVVLAGARGATALADRLAADTTTADLDIRPVALDVTDDRSTHEAARRVADAMPSIDVLINNAGIPGTWAPAADVGPEDFEAVLATNVLGPVRVTRAFLPLLRRGTHPRLVMVSSGMGSLSSQTQDPVYANIAHLPYPASKAALNMLAVQYAKALPDVIVTSVDPGLTATDFTDGVGQDVDHGAEAIITAALDDRAASGKFVDRHGPVRW